MDNWLRFQYHRKSYERSGDTEGQAEHAAGRACPSSEADMQANPHIERLGCYGEGKEVPEAADFTLSRKAASETVGARTANRHR